MVIWIAQMSGSRMTSLCFCYIFFEFPFWILTWNCILKAAPGTIHSSTGDINSDCPASLFLFSLICFSLAFISTEEACEPSKYKIDLWGSLIRHILLKRGCSLPWCQARQCTASSDERWELGFAHCSALSSRCHMLRWLTCITHTRLDTLRRLCSRQDSNTQILKL